MGSRPVDHSKRDVRQMQCTDFIEGYTDFRDGLLDEARTEAHVRHIESCSACARYDRVLRGGLELLHSLPEAESSDDFMSRLQHRLYNVDQGLPDSVTNRFVGSAALAAVAGVGLLALFWLPFAASVPIELELQPVAVERPSGQVAGSNELPSLFRSGPFVEPVSLLDDRAGGSYLDGEHEWYPTRRDNSRVFLAADVR